MSFEELQAKVDRAEAALEARERETAADFRVFGRIWRDGWTPPRIIIAGLAGGFLAGWLRPGKAIAGAEPARWLQLFGSVAGLVGSVQAAFAADEAREAAEDAGVAARSTDAAGPRPPAAAAAPVQPAPVDRGRRPEPVWDAPPPPAEAATELSETR